MKLQRRGQSIGPVTVSQGVAGFPDHGASAVQILQAADAALYRAKRGGRDRVVVAEV
jgi:diguanylate cyclase (GGDEF)-like protein